MDVVKVWVPLREYLSVQALYDAAIALHWKISERQNSTHLAFLKHQNTKTSLCELSKNHWVIALFKFLGPSEENYNLQSLWITLYLSSVHLHGTLHLGGVAIFGDHRATFTLCAR